MVQFPVFKALKISEHNLENLIQGRSIAILQQKAIMPEQKFALAPEKFSSMILIKVWARCELSKRIDNLFPLDILSQLIIISPEKIEAIFNHSKVLSLVYLRVYRLANLVELPANQNNQFIKLPETIYVSDDSPVLSDRDFARLKRQIENLEPPEPLDVQIQRMLEEAEIDHKIALEKDLAWVKTISTLGDRSIEQEEKKSNVQAGTDFEDIVKKGLEFLGFTIDVAYKGGAGGLDLFCSKPYPLTGECKAGKSIPSRTTEELIKLGGMRLGREKFLDSTKLIIGAGNPTPDVITASNEWKVSIIKAMTLQKLVELKAKYDGAIDLVKLKEYLQVGQIDTTIDEYIQKVEDEIRLRSHIVNLIKNHREETVKVETLFSAYMSYLDSILSQLYPDPDSPPPPQPIPNRRDLYEILIELSSPLAGYLGRKKGNDLESDRFYFLRDLSIE